MSNRPTIREIRAAVTARGVTIPTAAEIDAAIARCRGKGSQSDPAQIAFHATLTALTATDPVPPTAAGRFTYDWVTAHTAAFIDIPLDVLTATDGALTNLNNTYNLPIAQVARGERPRVTIATHLGTLGRIGWVTVGTSTTVRDGDRRLVRFFHREMYVPK